MDWPTAAGAVQTHQGFRQQIRLLHPGRSWRRPLAFGPAPEAPRVFNLSPTSDLREAAARLFSALRAADALAPAAIAVAPIPEAGLGEAINDRLRRAAGYVG